MASSMHQQFIVWAVSVLLLCLRVCELHSILLLCLLVYELSCWSMVAQTIQTTRIYLLPGLPCCSCCSLFLWHTLCNHTQVCSYDSKEKPWVMAKKDG